MFQEPKQLGYDKIDLPDELAKFVKISDVVNYLERREGLKTKAIKKCQGNHHSPYEVRLFLGPDAVVEGSSLPWEDRHVTIGLTTHKGGFRLYHRQVKAEIDPKKVTNLLHRVATFLKDTARLKTKSEQPDFPWYLVIGQGPPGLRFEGIKGCAIGQVPL